MKTTNRAENILNMIKQREEADLDPDQESYSSPKIDQVIGNNFDYDDIMHFLKIEANNFHPGKYDAQQTKRIAILCRMFLKQEF